MQAAHSHFSAQIKTVGLFSAAVNLLYIAPTIYMLQIYDRVVASRSTASLALLTLALLTALATLSALDRLRTRVLTKSGTNCAQMIADSVLRASLLHPDASNARTAVRDLDSIRSTISGPAMIALLDAPWTIVFVIGCFLLHPLIGAACILGIASIVFLTWLTERASQRAMLRARGSIELSYLIQQDLISASESVRALGMTDAVLARQSELRLAALFEQTSASLAGGRYVNVSKFIRLALQSLALGLGAWLALADSISVGAIFAASFLLSRALQPLDQIIVSIRPLLAARDQIVAVDELLIHLEHAGSHIDLPKPVGQLQVEQLTVHIEGREKPVLDQITFELEPGESLAIIGPSGSGKSTLLRSLVGVLRPTYGTVRYDGYAMTDWPLESLMQHVGYVPQNFSLLAGTVAENISRFTRSGKQNAQSCDAKILDAARFVGAETLIKRLPNGFGYRLGAAGGGLSAGQAQRIALARAVFGDPRYLFLDEPNSNLDGDGDLALVEAIRLAKSASKTLIISSHRLDIVKLVDKILIMRDGKIDVFGPRDKVISTIIIKNSSKE